MWHKKKKKIIWAVHIYKNSAENTSVIYDIIKKKYACVYTRRFCYFSPFFEWNKNTNTRLDEGAKITTLSCVSCLLELAKHHSHDVIFFLLSPDDDSSVFVCTIRQTTLVFPLSTHPSVFQYPSAFCKQIFVFHKSRTRVIIEIKKKKLYFPVFLQFSRKSWRNRYWYVLHTIFSQTIVSENSF